ncbi:hypothetical protein ACJ41O_004581 [Fusarium nematophilum]
MHFSSLAIAALVSAAQAIDVQVVAVGRNAATNATGLKFWPEKITAAPGTMVQFQFWAGNHTVTQSNFDNACVPIGNINSSIQGIYSGYQPVEASANEGMIPTFTIEIQDEKPLWLYCSQGKHCQGGMNMVINENTAANASRSLENYRTLAQSAPDANVVPVNGESGNGGNGGNGGGNDGGNNGGEGGNNGGDAGNGNGGGNNEPAVPTGIETPAPTGGAATPTGADGPGATESVVEAAAPGLSAPNTLLLLAGAAILLL